MEEEIFMVKGLNRMLDIIVVGGGAAGMMAAITARREGHRVVLLERNDRLGKKLLATGNGRCNYTNVNLTIDNFHGENSKFPLSCLSQFDVDRTMEFFEQLGISPAVDKGGKVFPHSYQSSSVLDILRLELEALGVELVYEALVRYIYREEDGFRVLTEEEAYLADRVIVTTGGLALPSSGSDGLGYSLVKDLGHRLTKTFPALVQLELAGDVFKALSGVKFQGEASLYIDGQLVKGDGGDILFTDYGISGPPILQLSRRALEGVGSDREVELSLDLVPGEGQEELLNYLYYRFALMGGRTIGQGLIGLINSKLIEPILREAGISSKKYISQLTGVEIEGLAQVLKAWSFRVTGSKSFKFAQATAGGIETDGLDPRTLESKLVEGLYLAGEIVDVDGDCGGFNLQWAWSSGYVAGLNASKGKEEK